MRRMRQFSPARAFRKVRHVGAPCGREAHYRAKASSGLRNTNVAPARVVPEVREAMLAALPSLRAFAMSLAHSPDHADDLVQDAIARALANIEKFEPGTNMSAWLFTILRNLFYSEHRRAKHEVADPGGSYAGQLRTAPDQGARCDFQDLRKALARLSPENREALILIAAEGMSYEEAAQVCGVAIGTIKSRVHRGRMRLAELLAFHDAEDFGPDGVMQAALQSAP
jgi:RNA polymerase sigma-70 factor (ECF subfamily)